MLSHANAISIDACLSEKTPPCGLVALCRYICSIVIISRNCGATWWPFISFISFTSSFLNKDDSFIEVVSFLVFDEKPK